ncbi:hypothetical protein E4U53_002364, partial [Claviceps sorghi]
CLLGLERQGTLDNECPNVEYHRVNENATNHAIDTKQLLRKGQLHIGGQKFPKRRTFTEC